MSGHNALLDTNVIVLLSKNGIDVDLLLKSYDQFYVSIITYMETYGYEFKNIDEKNIIDAFFTLVEVVDVNKSIANKVIAYKANSNRKIKLPDAVILATASYLGADLLTADWGDFLGVDKSVNIVKLDLFRKT